MFDAIAGFASAVAHGIYRLVCAVADYTVLTVTIIVMAPVEVVRWVRKNGGSLREFWIFSIRAALFVAVVTVPLALIEKYFGGNTVVQKVARAVLEQFVWSGIEYALFRWLMSEMEKAQSHAENDPYYSGFTYKQAS